MSDPVEMDLKPRNVASEYLKALARIKELEAEGERLRAEVKLHLNGERKLLARIEAALALHKPRWPTMDGKGYGPCRSCHDALPCPTVKALKGEKP